MTALEEIKLEARILAAVKADLARRRGHTASLKALVESISQDRDLGPGVSQDLVKSAVWQLMADRQAAYTPDYSIRLTDQR